jgi:YVTN family beta-propeller protein
VSAFILSAALVLGSIGLPGLAADAAAQFDLGPSRRARLNLRGHLTYVGWRPNLLAPGADPGTFLLGDLDFGWISIRRAADGSVLRSIYVGESTLGLAASAETREIYAANVRGSTVLIADLRRGSLVDSVLVGQSANLVAASADGRFVLATAFEPSLVSIFDRNFDFTRRTIVLDDRPVGLAVTQKRFPPRAYVVGLDRGKVFTIEFDPSSFAVIDTIVTRPGANFIALSPDESKAYISAGRSRVVAVALDRGFVEREIPVGEEPLGIDVSPDGRFVLVANSASDTVSLIETDRQIVIDEIPVGALPTDVLFVSNTRAYAALQGENALAVIDIVR